MKRYWDEQELAKHWSLAHDEFELMRNRMNHSRDGFATLLKFSRIERRFPSQGKDVPTTTGTAPLSST